MRELAENPIKAKLSFWRSIPKTLNLLAIMALASLAGKILFLNKIPGVFEGAQQLGLVVEGVLASVLASYIFYLMIVHKKEYDDLRAVRPFVNRQALTIAGRCKAMIGEFSDASQVDLNFDTFTENELRSALKMINPNSQAPLIIGPDLKHAKWFQYPMENIAATEARIERIYTQVKFLDAGFISLLAEIADSNYIHFLKSVNNSTQIMRNEDMTVFSSAIFKHVELCRKLQGLIER